MFIWLQAGKGRKWGGREREESEEEEKGRTGSEREETKIGMGEKGDQDRWDEEVQMQGMDGGWEWKFTQPWTRGEEDDYHFTKT